jgi:hypothetical protein
MPQAQSLLHPVSALPSGKTTVKKPIRRIVWKPDETEKVVARARELLTASPRMPMFVAGRRAQEEILPPERQKKIRQHKDVEKWLSPHISAPQSPPPTRRFPRAIQPPLPDPVKPAEVAASTAPEPEAPALPPSVQAVDPAIVRAVAEQITPAVLATFNECAHQLVGALVHALENAGVQPPAAAGVASHAKVTPPPRTRLPRVCVVGLINQQENDVAATFAGVIEFVFVKTQKQGSSGQGGPGMLNKSSSCDLVLAMIGFISHDVETAAKHLHVPFERINGSVSALKRWLREWLETGAKDVH